MKCVHFLRVIRHTVHCTLSICTPCSMFCFFLMCTSVFALRVIFSPVFFILLFMNVPNPPVTMTFIKSIFIADQLKIDNSFLNAHQFSMSHNNQWNRNVTFFCQLKTHETFDYRLRLSSLCLVYLRLDPLLNFIGFISSFDLRSEVAAGWTRVKVDNHFFPTQPFRFGESE